MPGMMVPAVLAGAQVAGVPPLRPGKYCRVCYRKVILKAVLRLRSAVGLRKCKAEERSCSTE